MCSAVKMNEIDLSIANLKIKKPKWEKRSIYLGSKRIAIQEAQIQAETHTASWLQDDSEVCLFVCLFLFMRKGRD